MPKLDLNDFAVDILQDLSEIASMLRVLKSSASNEADEILMNDVVNSLEIIIAKFVNTQRSLNKYIDATFE